MSQSLTKRLTTAPGCLTVLGIVGLLGALSAAVTGSWGVAAFWLLIAIGCVIYVIPRNREQKKQLDGARSLQSMIYDAIPRQLRNENFDPDNILFGAYSMSAIAYDDQSHTIATIDFIENHGEQLVFDGPHYFGPHDIVDVRIINDSRTVSVASDSDVIKRGLIGHLLGGDAGAVVGGITAQRTESQIVKSLSLELIFNSSHQPIFRHTILDLSEPQSADHPQVIHAMQQLEQWAAIAKIMMHQARHSAERAQ